MRILGICDGPPEEKLEVAIRVPGLEILPFREGVDQEKLNTFLAPLLDNE